mgnify:CR=1 FL=1
MGGNGSAGVSRRYRNISGTNMVALDQSVAPCANWELTGRWTGWWRVWVSDGVDGGVGDGD